MCPPPPSSFNFETPAIKTGQYLNQGPKVMVQTFFFLSCHPQTNMVMEKSLQFNHFKDYVFCGQASTNTITLAISVAVDRDHHCFKKIAIMWILNDELKLMSPSSRSYIQLTPKAPPLLPPNAEKTYQFCRFQSTKKEMEIGAWPERIHTWSCRWSDSTNYFDYTLSNWPLDIPPANTLHWTTWLLTPVQIT